MIATAKPSQFDKTLRTTGENLGRVPLATVCSRTGIPSLSIMADKTKRLSISSYRDGPRTSYS
jgi:hypothetical protein